MLPCGMIMRLILIVILVFVALAIAGALADRKRREALAALAARLGLQFSAERDYSLAAQFGFLDRLARGENRYAFNVMRGSYRGQPVLAGDYHYETHSTDSKGRRQTHHHYLGFHVLVLPARFPELTIGREGWLSKMAQAFGYDDIDFESHEFSRKFCVRSRDRKFAYDVCNARLIEYLLANTDLSIEIEGSTLAVVFDSRLDVGKVEGNLNRLVEIRSRMPDYLFTGVA